LFGKVICNNTFLIFLIIFQFFIKKGKDIPITEGKKVIDIFVKIIMDKSATGEDKEIMK
jgi:hypothetical protein